MSDTVVAAIISTLGVGGFGLIGLLFKEWLSVARRVKDLEDEAAKAKQRAEIDQQVAKLMQEHINKDEK